LYLALSDQIQINSYLYFEALTFTFGFVPFDIGIDVQLKAIWNENPPLNFDIGGQFNGNEVLLQGWMTGTWENAFGIKGFSLSNVIAELGFSPTMCAVDLCISDLGVGAQMTVGGDVVVFDGNVAAPDFWNVFLKGSISGNNGKILTVVGIVQDWNAINPHNQISTNGIPPGWGIDNVSFYFAPVDGTFGPIHYTKGFGVTGGITILDMNLWLSINCTESTGLSCDFAFDVDISLSTFSQMISNELNQMNKFNNVTFDIFTLKDVSLSEWSQGNVAQGVYPRWIIDIVVFNKLNHLDFRVEQYELASSFNDFFEQFLASLFN